MELKTKEVNEVAQPLSQGEKTFKGLHNPVKGEKLVPGVTDQDHVFKGSTKPYDNKFKNGYKPPEDQTAYDKNLTIDPSKNPIGHEKPTVGEGVIGKVGKAVASKVAGAVLSNILNKDTSKKILAGDNKKVRKEEVEVVDEYKNPFSGQDPKAKSRLINRKPDVSNDKDNSRLINRNPNTYDVKAKMRKEEAEVVDEKTLTPAELKKREEIAKKLPEKDFKKRYGKDWMSVKMATATKIAKEEVEHVEEEDTFAKDNHEKFGDDYVAKNTKVAKQRKQEVDSMKKSTPVKEQFVAEDHDEYDYEGEMAKTELRAMCDKAGKLADMLTDDQQLEAWLQSKISRAKDYIDAVYDYMMYRDKDKQDDSASIMPAISQSDSMAGTYGTFLNRMGEETEVEEEAKKGYKLDPVGKEDADIDNDGDTDKSDSYLHNRRKAIKANIKKESVLDDMIGKVLSGYINKVNGVEQQPQVEQVNEEIEDHPEFSEEEIEAFKQIMKEQDDQQ